jgi:hypothetical protein
VQNRTLSRLLRWSPLRSDSSYNLEPDAPFSFNHVINKSPGGIHSLRTELAPIDELDVRAFLADFTKRGDPIPRFNLSIKYGQQEAAPQDLINVFYRPPTSGPSGHRPTPAEGVIKYNADREKLDALYRRSREFAGL